MQTSGVAHRGRSTRESYWSQPHRTHARVGSEEHPLARWSRLRQRVWHTIATKQAASHSDQARADRCARVPRDTPKERERASNSRQNRTQAPWDTAHPAQDPAKRRLGNLHARPKSSRYPAAASIAKCRDTTRRSRPSQDREHTPLPQSGSQLGRSQSVVRGPSLTLHFILRRGVQGIGFSRGVCNDARNLALARTLQLSSDRSSPAAEDLGLGAFLSSMPTNGEVEVLTIQGREVAVSNPR